jgi:hypothetical protein
MTPEPFRPARVSRNGLAPSEFSLSGKLANTFSVLEGVTLDCQTSPIFDPLGRTWNLGFCFENFFFASF